MSCEIFLGTVEELADLFKADKERTIFLDTCIGYLPVPTSIAIRPSRILSILEQYRKNSISVELADNGVIWVQPLVGDHV